VPPTPHTASTQSLASTAMLEDTETLATSLSRRHLANVDPSQVLFIRSQFGACAPRSTVGWREAAKVSKEEQLLLERKQLRQAEQLGARVGQRIMARRSIMAPPDLISSEEDAAHGSPKAAAGGASSSSAGPSAGKAAWQEGLGQQHSPLSSILRPSSGKHQRLSKLNELRISYHKQLAAAITRKKGLSCHECKVILPDDSIFCTNCGAVVARVKVPPARTKRQNGAEAPASPIDEHSGSKTPSADTDERGYSKASLGFEPSDDPEVDALQDAFFRYDDDGSGLLDVQEIRAALNDIGLQPSLPEEKRAILRVIAEAVGESEGGQGIDFQAFHALVPRLREAVRESKRADLEEWYARGLDENGAYDLGQLQACLEALGSWGPVGEEEWQEVLQLFGDFNADLAQPDPAKPRKPAVRDRKTVFRRRVPEAQPQSTASMNSLNLGARFERFEKLFHEAQERLTGARRARERGLAKALKLTEEVLEEFRSDLIELHQLFLKYDTDESGVLEPAEVARLLVACGCGQARAGLALKTLSGLIMKAKRNAARGPRKQRAHGAGWGKVMKRCGIQSDAGGDESPILFGQEEGLQEVSFVEFLHLMRILREIDRKAQQERLRQIFDHYDTDKSNEIGIKEITRLFSDLGLQPRTRQEQLEIRMILDEADDNGNGTFAFEEFEVVVQRAQERIDRLTRLDEEKFALELGFSLARCRDLRKVFADHATEDAHVLFVEQLRTVMDGLSRKYTSEELLRLYQAFSSEGNGGIDSKSFLRMMHAIEIAKTHGQLRQPQQAAAGPGSLSPRPAAAAASGGEPGPIGVAAG